MKEKPIQPASSLKAARAVLICAGMSISGAGTAGPPLYDFKQPVRDGVTLVGMECNRKRESLELGIFDGRHPPGKRMDLWNTSDLVAYDAGTSRVSSVLHVERACTIGSDHYRVRLAGLPGAPNAMWACGAVITAKASVWKNGRLVYERALLPCGVENAVRLVRFFSGTDRPALVIDRQ